MDRILIIDDDEFFLASLKNLLTYKNYDIDVTSNPISAKESFKENNYDLVLLDVKMPGINGIELLEEFQSEKRLLPVIMISGQSNISIAVEALKKGAFDFIEKPVDPERLLNSIKNALDRQKLYSEKNRLVQALKEKYQMIGRSPALMEIFDTIDQVADFPTKVLITGESGTGKELVARAIHFAGNRSSGPFVKLNCAAIPKELMENELFGHKKGAYTGASVEQKGKLQAAHGGTLFLDEIGDMDLILQAKLLHVLQDNEFIMLGSSDSVKVDVRIVAATNQNLEKLIEVKRFRKDLYHRLNVVNIHIPPLRERKEDIEPLTKLFLREFAETYNKKVVGFSLKAQTILQHYNWPGNVRELKNVIEKMVIFTHAEIIDENITLRAMGLSRKEKTNRKAKSGTLKEIINNFEKEIILKALAETNGNISKAARTLGLTRSALFKKKHRLGID